MSGRAGRGASASGSRGIFAGSKKSVDSAKLDSIARASRLQSRAASSGKGDGLSEAAAAQSSKPKQPQAGTATDLSPMKRQRVQVGGGSRARAFPTSDSDDEDEISVSGAATTSEENGRDKLRKCARMPVQKFKIHSSNIIIVAASAHSSF